MDFSQVTTVVVITLVALVSTSTSSGSSELGEPVIIPVNGAEFGKVYNNAVNTFSSVMFFYRLKRTKDKDTTILRMKLETFKNDSVVEYPIYATVIQPKVLSSSFEVPFVFMKGQKHKSKSDDGEKGPYYVAERTLCILDEESTEGELTNITIVISTRSKDNVTFRLVVNEANDFLLSIDEPRSIQVSPASPTYYGFSFAHSYGHSKVKVLTSADSSDGDPYCMTISIQTFSCPIFDLEQTVNYEGQWKTISSSGAMTVKASSNYETGFVVVLVAHSSHDLCLRRDPFSVPASGNNFGILEYRNDSLFPVDPFLKTITLNITGSIEFSTVEIIWSALLPLVLTIFIAFMSSYIFSYYNNCNDEEAQPSSESIEEGGQDECQPSSSTSQSAPRASSSTNAQFHRHDNHGVPCIFDNLNESTSLLGNHPRQRLNGDIPPVSTVWPGEGGRRRGLWRSDVMLSHFDDKCSEENRYFSLTGTVGWFYLVPVCQFAIYYYRVFISIGDLDMCYYNDRCANQVGPIVDFNHLWSNSSYMIFGTCFIFIVRKRRKQLVKKNVLGSHGVRPPFGILYALGISLIMEGALSATYHLCPNQATFQFDTCFMYVIAILILLKLHHNRHPRFCKPEHTFLILAGMLTLPVIELMFETIITPGSSEVYFWILFVIQYVGLILIAITYCLIGYVRDPANENKQVMGLAILHPNHVLNSANWKNVHGSRFVIPFCLVATSVGVLIYRFLADLPVSSYILYVLVANAIVTIICYIILKFLNGEFRNYMWIQPLIYLTVGLGLGLWSGTYFVNIASEWALSPSASRKLNTDCKVMFLESFPRFYDAHDYWHFISSASLFFTFMGLLVMDNDLTFRAREEVPVF